MFKKVKRAFIQKLPVQRKTSVQMHIDKDIYNLYK